MDRNELAAGFMSSFLHPMIFTEADRLSAIDKAYMLADDFLKRAQYESSKISKAKELEHIYSGDVYIDDLTKELQRLYISLGAGKTIANKGQVLRLVERFTVPPGVEPDGNETQNNDVG